MWYFYDFYGKPWYRIHAFLIGVIFGFIFVDIDRSKKIKFSSILSFFTWIVIAGLTVLTLWVTQVYSFNNNERDPSSFINTKTEAECILEHPEEACIPKASYMYNYTYRWPLWAEALYNALFRPLLAINVGLVRVAKCYVFYYLYCHHGAPSNYVIGKSLGFPTIIDIP